MTVVSTSLLREALRVLGIERLALGVHDACFPCDPSEDLGRGSPYGSLARDVLRFAAELGFDTIQLGPQGECAPINPSPYDGAAFARSTLSLALGPLVEQGLLTEATCLRLTEASDGARSDHTRAAIAVREVLDEVQVRAQASGAGLEARLGFVATHAGWLLADATYEALLVEHRYADFLEWTDPYDRSGYAWPSDASLARRIEIEARGRSAIDRWVLAQALLHEQHAEFREHAHTLGLSIFADLQIGWSRRDLWANQRTFLRELRLGAPPSRTNPAGQPWGYPVLDPAQPAAVQRLVDARFGKLAAEYDGVRIDHPHGWVCPWVYRPGEDEHAAVRAGARLHESPDLPDLARFAIARVDQLDNGRVRWDDRWVRTLDDGQVDAYARHVDRLVTAFGGAANVACEVLSTMPYPLARVVERHRFARFRVTQKVGLEDETDVYRSENALPEDWIMVGNHDTEPIWTVAARWVAEGAGPRHARYLADRLVREPSDRAAFVERVAADPYALARAKLAELFASPARNVFVWWADLLGETEIYNRPGVVDPRNWTLRMPRDFRAVHGRRVAIGAALDLRAVLGTALRARGHDELARALDPDGV